MKQIVLLLTMFFGLYAEATTWNEPWADSVISNADSFGLYRVIKVDEDKATLKLIKFIAGDKTPQKIRIDGYSQLALYSGHYGHGTELGLHKGKDTYFLLNKTKSKKTWKIATPTSGFDILHEGRVFANFRHSYHRFEAPPEQYELVMGAIFKKYQGLKFERKKIDAFISKQLSIAPSVFKEDITHEGMQQHFLQQLALEAIHHLGGNWQYTDIEPFIKSTGYYTEISATRSLISIDIEDKSNVLCDLITTDINGFSKVILLWYLEPQKNTTCANTLAEFVGKASSEEIGFGGSIMDARVGTHFPESEQAAIQAVLDHWGESLPNKSSNTGAEDAGS